MSWTKRQFVEQAFEEIGAATYVFDLEPEQLQTALKRLDAMMATWNSEGIRVGYPIPSSPEDSDLDTETAVPDAANEAIYTNLAIKLAPTIGKTVPAETRMSARLAYQQLLARTTKPVEAQLHNLPMGQGNKPWRNREYLPEPTDSLAVGDDALLDLE